MTNHIPDIGKMVGDTPRTDAAWKPDGGDYFIVDVDLARQLERELNASNSKIELLMSANADVARIADERDAAEQRIHLLIAERDTARRQADQKYNLREEFLDILGTDDVEQGVAVVREMKQRIKRLEEAGDAMERLLPDGSICDKAANLWLKAKEDKP
jgi:histidyl-tRNA synthetase